MTSVVVVTLCSALAANGWVDGPAAPRSTAPVPPATAPRDGETEDLSKRPQEILVVPERPPEDTRVDVDDELPPTLADLRLSTTFDRLQLSRSAMLDLESFLRTAPTPGFVFVPTAAGGARAQTRGHDALQTALVVDDVPIVDGYGLVSPTETLSLVGASSLTLRHGPRAFSSTSALGGVIEVDTGGPLTDMGESGRTDGLLGGGVGGADLEKGVTAALRTGWREARVIGHATVLHRDDQRSGRELSATSGSVLRGTNGAGGTAGVRVDVAPFAASRLFFSWFSGRSVDTRDPSTCTSIAANGRFADCVRTVERGADVGIVGFDIARHSGDLVVVPRVRLHLQRALADDERSGTTRLSIDRARDEVVRGGVSLGTGLRLAAPSIVQPSADVGVDFYADRATSSFHALSLRPGDAQPGEGLALPAQARLVDGAVARFGVARARVRLEHEVFSIESGARLRFVQLGVDTVGDRRAVDDVLAAPAADVTGRVQLLQGVSLFASIGVVNSDDVRAAMIGPGFATTRALTTTSDDRFVEVGLNHRHAAVDIDVVAFASARTRTVIDDVTSIDQQQGVLGLESRATVKPALDGLTATVSVAGVLVDDGVFSETSAPASRTIQPQVGLYAQYQPTTLPFGLYARVVGALPQTRLSPAEEGDAALCPERAGDNVLVADAPCTGVAGFALVDVGAYLQLGALRFDIGGDNLLDQQGTWRGQTPAALGSGGAAARARVAFLF